jgi:hypothetical protein
VMGDRRQSESDHAGSAGHPSGPFRWVAEYATYEEVVWAIELSDAERRRHLLELAARGPISALDRDSLARFAALVTVVRDQRALGLDWFEI